MRKRFKIVFIVNALAAVRALQLIDPNLLPYDYPEWTEVRGYRKLHLLFQLKGFIQHYCEWQVCPEIRMSLVSTKRVRI